MTETPGDDRSPLELLQPLALEIVEVAPGLHHLELYTLTGLLTVLWHGPRPCERVVVACGGAMGGMLGPAGGLYHDLGVRFAAQGIATLRVGYRRPNHLDECVQDLAAAAQLALEHGGRQFVTMGHSFGGAVAIGAAIVLGRHTAGVVTLATQSAGCEDADLLRDTPLLLLHGDRDELLPAECSLMVRDLAGHGELHVLPGAGHLLREAGDDLRRIVGEWIPARFDGER
jgi:pimeloyl-ACP methyl ester carboxylesterase